MESRFSLRQTSNFNKTPLDVENHASSIHTAPHNTPSRPLYIIKAARAAATTEAPMTAPAMWMLAPASESFGAMVGEEVGRNSPTGISEAGHSAPSLSYVEV